MSRIGNQPITIPDGIKVTVDNRKVVISGQKGSLEVKLLPKIEVEVKDGEVIVARKNDQRQTVANHGLIRSLINNQVLGITKGYAKTLELVGTGYKAALKGRDLTLNVGFSHPVEIKAPEGVQFKVEGNNVVHVSGIDKQLIGQIAADIRAVKPPEPYKGKGIRYKGEIVRRKQGKAAV